MSRRSFEEFINAQAAEPTFSAKRAREEWLRYLGDFYERVRRYLQPYVEQDKVRIEESRILLNEEQIGSYDAPQLSISMGTRVANLVPIGTNLIGAKGRVDMRGPHGVVRFVLADKASSGPRVALNSREVREDEPPPIYWDWKIATSPPNVRYLDVSEDTFLDSLLEVVNG